MRGARFVAAAGRWKRAPGTAELQMPCSSAEAAAAVLMLAARPTCARCRIVPPEEVAGGSSLEAILGRNLSTRVLLKAKAAPRASSLCGDKGVRSEARPCARA